jgi:large subunit ribosomal protein L4
MALSDKALGGKLVVLDTLELKDAKTKALAGKLGKLDLGNRALFIDGDAVHASFAMASANLIGIDAMPAAGANVYDIIRADTLVLTRAAVEKLEARFNG